MKTDNNDRNGIRYQDALRAGKVIRGDYDIRKLRQSDERMMRAEKSVP